MFKPTCQPKQSALDTALEFDVVDLLKDKLKKLKPFLHPSKKEVNL